VHDGCLKTADYLKIIFTCDCNVGEFDFSNISLFQKLKMAEVVVICSFFVAQLMFQPVNAYKILLIPVPGKSHVFPLAAIGKGLAERGHNVTMLLGRNFPFKVEEGDRQSNFDVERYEDFGSDYASMYEEMFYDSLEQELGLNKIVPRLLVALV
jgi:hypothetical protein